MTKAAFCKTLGGKLEPIDAAAQEFMGRLKPGAVVRMEVSRARNPRRMRLFWAIADICERNSHHRLSKRAWGDLLKVIGGHVEIVKRRGEVLKLPKSIAFDAMSEAEFSEFLNNLMDGIRIDIIPGLPESELRKELERITGLTDAAA